MIRLSAVACVLLLLALVFGFAAGDHRTAAQGNGSLLHPVIGYDDATATADTGTGNGNDPYPAGTLTESPTEAAGTPLPEFTVTSTVTPPPNLYQTEDSEINHSRTTPVATDTPGPTITPYVTATAVKTRVRPTPTPVPIKEKSGFSIDWGMFLFGFSLPILAACGYVLYLLDRRPDLFKRFRR